MKKQIDLKLFTLTLLTLLILIGCGSSPSEPAKKESKGQDATSSEETNIATPEEKPAKEIPLAPLSDLESGKIVYQKHCHYCHGKEGRGDGPVGIAVNPKPVDFVANTKRMAKPDAELFDSISNGINKETGGFGEKFDKRLLMPPFKGVLSEKERLDVVVYIRFLSRTGREKDKNAH